MDPQFRPKTRRPSTRADRASRPAEDSRVGDTHALRLRRSPQGPHDSAGQPPVGAPIEGATDPRWILAVRTAESLQGDVLGPQKREQLQRLGRMLGLRPFDVSLVIAIVQDQARQGFAPDRCPAAGQRQLELVLPPEKVNLLKWLRSPRGITSMGWVGAVVLLELIVLWAMMR